MYFYAIIIYLLQQLATVVTQVATPLFIKPRTSQLHDSQQPTTLPFVRKITTTLPFVKKSTTTSLQAFTLQIIPANPHTIPPLLW